MLVNLLKIPLELNFILHIAMLAAIDVVKRLKEMRINALHIKLRARGGQTLYIELVIKAIIIGVDTKTPGPGAQAALRALARFGIYYDGLNEDRLLLYQE